MELLMIWKNRRSMMLKGKVLGLYSCNLDKNRWLLPTTDTTTWNMLSISIVLNINQHIFEFRPTIKDLLAQVVLLEIAGNNYFCFWIIITYVKNSDFSSLIHAWTDFVTQTNRFLRNLWKLSYGILWCLCIR